MTLVRNVYNEYEPARLQVVAYRVAGGVLTRRESLATRDLMQLDVLWKAATSNGDTTPPVALQNGVIGMVVQTWEGGGWRSGGPARVNVPAVPNAPAIAAPTPTGLQVALQVKDVQMVMTKSFLLGGL